jgi:hypothetical protein
VEIYRNMGFADGGAKMSDMIDRIGLAAGEIWRYLEGRSEGISLSRLKIGTQLPSDLFHQGLGWLAREDKIRFFNVEKTLRIVLK